jgi:hypothetical protein
MSTPLSILFRWVSPVLLAVAVLGCGNGDGDGTGPTGSFSVNAPASLTIEAGTSATVQVTITRSGGFAEAVTLTLEDHPLALTHDAPAAYGTTAIVTLTFTVAATMEPGTYSIRACGSAAGMSMQCTTITLTVTAPSPGSFTLALNPASLSIEAGHTATVAITLTRVAPFSGPVTLDVATFSNLPGVTFTFEPAIIPTTGTTATATIAVAADAPAMVYTGIDALWIMGKNGDLRYDALLHLTVTAYPGEFSLAVAPAALSVEQGKSGTATVTIARTAPFAGAVALVVEGAPAGVTGSFVPAVIPSGATEATLTLSVGQAAEAGMHQLTIRASGTGVPDQHASLDLTVTEAPGFTLLAGASGVQQGQVGAAGVLVTRKGGFTGAVTLALEGVPAGVNAWISPVTVPAGEVNASLVYPVLATATVGMYQMTLRGTGVGVPDVSLPVWLEIRAAPAGNVTFTFCSPVDTPIWFGYQNGDNQWTQLAGPGGVFNFPITADRGGVAWVVPWQDEPGFYVGMILATQAELIELGSLWCQTTLPRKSLTGTVANVGTDWYNVSIGDASQEVHDGTPLTYQLHDVPIGLSDLVASKTTIPVGATSSTMIIRRGVNYPAGGVIPLLDFSSAEAFLTTTMQATVENYGAEVFRFTQAYVTAGGTVGRFAHRTPKTAQTPYMVVPAAQAQAGDFYSLKVETSWQQDGTANRTVVRSFDTPNDVTLTLGPDLIPPTVFTLQAAPLYQVRVATTWQVEYGNVFNGMFFQDTRDGEFYVSRGYLGAGAAFDLTTPDLRFVPGWNSTWGPVPGALTVLRGVAYGWTGVVGTLFPGFSSSFLTTPNVTMRSAAAATVTVP